MYYLFEAALDRLLREPNTMDRFYILKPPEIDGSEVLARSAAVEGLGASHLDAVLKLYSRDPLIEFSSGFLVTEDLVRSLGEVGSTGYKAKDASVRSDGGFEKVLKREFPKFRRLEVTGTAGRDDFGLVSESTLIVSRRVRDLIKAKGAKDSLWTPYDPTIGLWTPLKLRISSDSNWEARVNEFTDELPRPRFETRFAKTYYGAGIADIFIVLTCRDPALRFRQRIKWLEAERALELDVMLPLEEMITATTEERCQIGAQCMLRDISKVLKKYKISGFDSDRFLADMDAYFRRRKWL